ncbi:hypothetical protein G7968_07600 [Ralstonia solanacearum]|nr:hypothetical protein G7968_07600 [Ralstonia solanacearum]
MNSELKDMEGKAFYAGAQFIKPVTSGRSALLEKRTAELRNGKLYSRGSKVAIYYPERCYIIGDRH